MKLDLNAMMPLVSVTCDMYMFTYPFVLFNVNHDNSSCAVNYSRIYRQRKKLFLGASACNVLMKRDILAFLEDLS
jgi:hypothetical protein